MGIPTSTRTLGTVYTAAAQTHIDSMLHDNSFIDSPSFTELRKNKITKRGGERLVYGVEVGGEPLGGAMAKADILDMQDSENIVQAEYKWKVYAEPIVIWDKDKFEADGDEYKLFDLVQSKTDSAMKKLKTKVFRALYVASPTAKELLGLPSAIATTPATSGEYGGLDGAATSQPGWRNYDLSLGSFNAGGMEALATMIRTITNQATARKPTALFTSATVWGYIHSQAENFTEISKSPATSGGVQYANFGYEVLEYMGIPIISDPYATSDVIWAVNSKAIQIVEGKGHAFALHEAGFQSKVTDGQLAMVSAAVWYGAIVTSERRALGKLYGITQ